MTFRFAEGEAVTLKEDRTDFLPAGSQGIVFCQYTTLPPAYEVNFQDADGEEFGAVVSEDELEPSRLVAVPLTREAVGAV